MPEKPSSIILINRFFGGAQTPTGRMASDFVDNLLADGHRVSVLTSLSNYTQSDSATADSRIKMHFTIGRSGAGRLESWFGFWLQTLFLLPFLHWKRCIIMTDPPFLIFAGVFAKLFHPTRKLYWWTMDLYPEALTASEMTFFGKSLVTNICSGLTNFCIKYLSGVICLGYAQKKRLANYKNWPKDDSNFCIVIPPWDFRDFNESLESIKAFKNDMGWGSRNIALYAGNLGEAHSYAYVLRLAKEMLALGDSSWLFAFFCRGAKVSELKRDANSLGNVFISDYLSADFSGKLLAAADLHIITMSDGWEGIVVPSKLYGVLNTEAPILFIGPATADTATELQTYSIGWTESNDADVKVTVEKLKHLNSRSPISNKTADLDQMAMFITAGI